MHESSEDIPYFIDKTEDSPLIRFTLPVNTFEMKGNGFMDPYQINGLNGWMEKEGHRYINNKTKFIFDFPDYSVETLEGIVEMFDILHSLNDDSFSPHITWAVYSPEAQSDGEELSEAVDIPFEYLEK